jgi:DNA-binding NtrC family response regulator
LLENELFGHARGAYTDAQSNQKGLVAMADGGSLFIDEIDGLSVTAQAKLLRFLQDKTYRPLGSDRFYRAEVRVIAASNQDLDGLSAAGRFRSDLFFRLNVLRLELPSLRDRPDDVLPLARHFLDEAALETGMPARQLHPEACECLQAYHWPGNVRELRNAMYRAAVLAGGPEISADELSPAIRHSTPDPQPILDFHSAKSRAVEGFEKNFVARLLLENGGNVTRAAKSAGKERRAFGRLVKKHGLKGAQANRFSPV